MFPVEINRADYRDLLRVPGIGPKSARALSRRAGCGSLRIGSLAALGVVMRRARWFITVSGKLAAKELDEIGIGAAGAADVGWDAAANGGTGGTVVPAGLLSKTAARASVEAEFR